MHKLRMWVALAGLIIALMVASNVSWMSKETSHSNQDTVRTGTPDQSIVSIVTDATYAKEVLQARVKTPVLIWFNRPERSGVFQADARAMEMIATLWANEKTKVKVVRIDTAKLKKDGPIDREFRAASGVAMTFTITQDSGPAGDTHHHDIYMMHPEVPLDVSRHVQAELLDFKPDCPRTKCPNCMGEQVWGTRPLAWR